MYQWERMSRVRVTCLANGDQIYEWSQQFFFKIFVNMYFGDFCFQTSFIVYFGVLYKKKKQCKEMRQHFLKLELFSPWIYFKMKKKQCELIVEKFFQTVYICSKLPKWWKKKRKLIISKGVVWSSSKCIFDLIDLIFF